MVVRTEEAGHKLDGPTAHETKLGEERNLSFDFGPDLSKCWCSHGGEVQEVDVGMGDAVAVCVEAGPQVVGIFVGVDNGLHLGAASSRSKDPCRHGRVFGDRDAVMALTQRRAVGRQVVHEGCQSLRVLVDAIGVVAHVELHACCPKPSAPSSNSISFARVWRIERDVAVEDIHPDRVVEHAV